MQKSPEKKLNPEVIFFIQNKVVSVAAPNLISILMEFTTLTTTKARHGIVRYPRAWPIPPTPLDCPWIWRTWALLSQQTLITTWKLCLDMNWTLPTVSASICRALPNLQPPSLPISFNIPSLFNRRVDSFLIVMFSFLPPNVTLEQSALLGHRSSTSG